MKTCHTILVRFLKKICFLLVFCLPLQISAQDLILEAMKTEADRCFTILKEQPVPAYYMAYLVYDVEKYALSAQLGKLHTNDQNRDSHLRVRVRVGSHEMDNMRKISGPAPFFDISDIFTSVGYETAPIEEQPFALRMKLWEHTNKLYQREAKNFERIKAVVGVNAEKSDQSGDFTREIPEQYYEAPVSFKDLKFDPKKWEEKIKKYSQIFDSNKDLVDGWANLNVELVRKNFVDTDRAVIAQNKITYRLSLTVRTIADDGMVLPVYQSYFALEEKDLPSDAVVIADAQRISKLASQLKNAPMAEPYSGPAIISSKASCLFFHEIFGHRIEGSRLKQESDAQTLKNKLGEAVLPEDISVVFDPQLKEHKGMPLRGGYVFDDEGVRGQRVAVVENGILKSFLMSRTPIDGFPKSNGHGRGVISSDLPVARQSNMIVETSRPKSDHELRKMLLDEIKRTGKEYGYLFDEVTGGSSVTNRIMPNVINVTPLVVYRIYADGKPDELVRGINMIGSPLSVLSQIAACGEKYDVLNSTCNGESGSIPFSCVAPSLFVKMIETQRKSKSESKPPLLERPQTFVPSEHSVISAIKKEVDRNFSGLKMEGLPSPFFISYAILDQHSMEVKASFGAITQSFDNRERRGLPLLLVGDFHRNNIRYNFTIPPKIMIDNDAASIRVPIWTDLDKEYKKAIVDYETKKATLAQTQQTPEEQALPNYEKTPAVNLILPPEKINNDRKYWENFARTASAIAQKYPEIIESKVDISFQNGVFYYYDTEGSQFAVPDVRCFIAFTAGLMTDDGEKLTDYISCYRSSTERLPNLETFAADCENLITRLLRLKNAPLVDLSYIGPVLYEKKSLAELVSSSLFTNTLIASGSDHKIEMMIGERFMSRDLTVKSLSRTKTYNGQILDGYFPVDSEGVIPDEELVIVEDGILKNMLSDRIPTVKNQHSNGHKRLSVFSNLERKIQPGVIQITGQKMYSDADRKKELIKAAREAGLEYAYIVNEGLTRIYVDDGREELVRGRSPSINFNFNNNLFRKVLSVSDEEYIHTTGSFSSTCPVSTYIIPKSMLFEELEISKENRSNLSTPYVIPKPIE